jgi:hypothetical protein
MRTPYWFRIEDDYPRPRRGERSLLSALEEVEGIMFWASEQKKRLEESLKDKKDKEKDKTKLTTLQWAMLIFSIGPWIALGQLVVIKFLLT